MTVEETVAGKAEDEKVDERVAERVVAKAAERAAAAAKAAMGEPVQDGSVRVQRPVAARER